MNRFHSPIGLRVGTFSVLFVHINMLFVCSESLPSENPNVLIEGSYTLDLLRQRKRLRTGARQQVIVI